MADLAEILNEDGSAPPPKVADFDLAEENAARPDEELAGGPIGRVVSVSGSSAIVLLQSQHGGKPYSPEIGSAIAIRTKRTSVIATVAGLSVPAPSGREGSEDELWVVEVELIGEYFEGQVDGKPRFTRGVSFYPSLGDPVLVAQEKELRTAYGLNQSLNVPVGRLKQNLAIPAVLRIGEFISRHAAIVGSTGSGKSCATALILNTIINKLPEAHMVVLDPHNEYAASLGDRAEVVNSSTLDLPYWMLTFEELCAILFVDVNPEEARKQIDILAEIITAAKRMNASAGEQQTRRNAGAQGPSVDTPSPYRISDVIGFLDSALGKLDNRQTLAPYKALKQRIEAITQDARYAFMFGRITVQDTMADIIANLLRIPTNGRPVTILELAGLPEAAIDVVVAAVSRLMFEFGLWSGAAAPVTLVCEEAHRYIPADTSRGFAPARKNLARIAKEGRKYGVSLIVVSQRPSDLDQTVLSQCNTMVAMRTVNGGDCEVLRSSVPEASNALMDALPALSVGEAVILGEGVQIPTRMRFDALAKQRLPRSTRANLRQAWTTPLEDASIVQQAIARWRSAGRTQ